MNIEEYNKYIQQKSKDELIGIKNNIDKEQYADKYEILLAEIEKRDSTPSAADADASPDNQGVRNNLYAGFWKRLGSYLLDFIILIPLMYFVLWGNEQSRLFSLYYFVPGILFGLWFHAYLVKRYGGTPGKLLLKIKITKLDGGKAGYREVLIRYSVLLVFSIIMSAAQLSAILNMSNELYYSLEWMERAKLISENMPTWYPIAILLMNIWVWSEFVVMLTNQKRRAIHDYMAGTVVIYSDA